MATNVNVASVTTSGFVGRAAPPRLDANRHRSTAHSQKAGVKADFVADKHWFVEHHAIDGYRAAAPVRATGGGRYHQPDPFVPLTRHRKCRRMGWHRPASRWHGSTVHLPAVESDRE